MRRVNGYSLLDGLGWQPQIEEGQAVDPLALYDDLPMQVRRAAASAVAAQADNLPGADARPRFDMQFGEVGITGKDAVTVIEYDAVAADLQPTGEDDLARRQRVDRHSGRRLLIPARMPCFSTFVQNAECTKWRCQIARQGQFKTSCVPQRFPPVFASDLSQQGEFGGFDFRGSQIERERR